MLTWLPEPWSVLPGLLLWRGTGIFLFGLLTGSTMHQMIRARHRAQVERTLRQFD
jgi:hypothetical protein